MPSLRACVIALLVGLFLGGIIRSFIYEIKGNKSEMHTNASVDQTHMRRARWHRHRRRA